MQGKKEMKQFIVAIPKDEYGYDWIASFETADAAESYAIKFENAIVVYGVESISYQRFECK